MRRIHTPICHMAPLPHRDLRHLWLRYQVDGYDEGVTLGDRLSMIYTRDDGGGVVYQSRMEELGGVRRRMTWMQFILALGLHSKEEMAEPGFVAYWAGSERVIPDKGDLRDYWIEISSDRDFLGPAPSYIHIRDLVRRLCHRMIVCSISGRGQGAEKYLFHHAEGRKSRAWLFGGHFIGRLAAHFGLISDEGLRGLLVVVSELPVIDLHELGRLNICGYTWAWVALGPVRQQAAVTGAPAAAEGALAVDEGAQAVPAPLQAPQPPPPAPRPQTLTQRIDRIEEEMRELRQSIVGLRGVVKSSITEQTRVSTRMISCMTQLRDTSGCTYHAFDNIHVDNSRFPYQRRVRPRTGDANTFAALITFFSL
ncbi:hypothetical protein Tco_0499288 [Tanacetum coccineum]